MYLADCVPYYSYFQVTASSRGEQQAGGTVIHQGFFDSMKKLAARATEALQAAEQKMSSSFSAKINEIGKLELHDYSDVDDSHDPPGANRSEEEGCNIDKCCFLCSAGWPDATKKTSKAERRARQRAEKRLLEERVQAESKGKAADGAKGGAKAKAVEDLARAQKILDIQPPSRPYDEPWLQAPQLLRNGKQPYYWPDTPEESL